MNVVFINVFVHTSAAAGSIALDLGNTISQTWEIRSLVAEGVAGSVGLSGAASSVNVPANIIGIITNCNFTKVTTPLAGITTDDIRWNFDGNSGVEDTRKSAMVSLSNNATATTISGADTPTAVLGTFVCEKQSHYDCTVAGRVTYIGEVDHTVIIDISATISAASGTNKDVHAYVALNGTEISASGKKGRVGSTDPRNVPVIWEADIVKDDYFEVFLENNSDAIDLIGEDIVMRVS